MILFQPNFRLGHPEIYVFLFYTKHFAGITYPKKDVFNFEDRIIGAVGATSIVFEGVPSYPDNSRCWEIVEKHKVKQFYTAPTAIRALMSHGDDPVTKHDRSSLQILGSVGEPINPEAWRW